MSLNIGIPETTLIVTLTAIGLGFLSNIATRLLVDLKKEKRLALVGYNAFHEHHQTVHEHLERLKIPHEYRDEKKPKHTWDAGWLDDAVRFLSSAAQQ